MFGTSISRNISPRDLDGSGGEPDQQSKGGKELDGEDLKRRESQLRSNQPSADLATTRWRAKKFLPRNELSHDSIQFVVAADDGTLRAYKRYRNARLNQSVDLAAASSSNLLLGTSDRKDTFEDQKSQSNAALDDEQASPKAAVDRAANRKFLKQFRRDLASVDSPVKDYK